MGGYGSGWQGPKKATVEDGLWLSVTTIVKKKGTVWGLVARRPELVL